LNNNSKYERLKVEYLCQNEDQNRQYITNGTLIYI